MRAVGIADDAGASGAVHEQLASSGSERLTKRMESPAGGEGFDVRLERQVRRKGVVQTEPARDLADIDSREDVSRVERFCAPVVFRPDELPRVPAANPFRVE